MKSFTQFAEEFVNANHNGELFVNPTSKELKEIISQSQLENSYRFMIDFADEKFYAGKDGLLHGDMFYLLGWGSQEYVNYYKNGKFSDVLVTGTWHNGEVTFDTLENDFIDNVQLGNMNPNELLTNLQRLSDHVRNYSDWLSKWVPPNVLLMVIEDVMKRVTELAEKNLDEALKLSQYRQFHDLEAPEWTDKYLGGKQRIVIPFKDPKPPRVQPDYEIQNALRDNDFEVVDYVEGVVKKKDGKQPQRMGRVLKKIDDRLERKYQKQLQHVLKGSEPLSIVISGHPYDIAGQTSGRHWEGHSCKRLGDGSAASWIPAEIEEGYLVAYVIRNKDLESRDMLRKPVSRLLLVPYYNAEDEDRWILYPAETVYGAQISGFKEAVEEWLESVQGSLDGFYCRGEEGYEDVNKPFIGEGDADEFWRKKFGGYVQNEEGEMTFNSAILFDVFENYFLNRGNYLSTMLRSYNLERDLQYDYENMADEDPESVYYSIPDSLKNFLEEILEEHEWDEFQHHPDLSTYFNEEHDTSEILGIVKEEYAKERVKGTLKAFAEYFTDAQEPFHVEYNGKEFEVTFKNFYDDTTDNEIKAKVLQQAEGYADWFELDMDSLDSYFENEMDYFDNYRFETEVTTRVRNLFTEDEE